MEVLPVHLEGDNDVPMPQLDNTNLPEEEEQAQEEMEARVEEAREEAVNNATKLIAFFALCSQDGEDGDLARGLLYREIPDHFWWKNK